MNWGTVRGSWTQFAAKAKDRWGKLTDDHLDAIQGRRSRLVRKIQEQYGISRQDAEKQLTVWEIQFRNYRPREDARWYFSAADSRRSYGS